MYSIEVIAKSISSMDDHQLIQRWKDGLFSDSARPIAENELLKRGINPDDPATHNALLETDLSPTVYKPKVLPLLFSIIASVTVGKEFGAALAGAIGAGILSIIVFILGWYIGRAIANFSHRQKNQLIRIIVPIASFIAWFYLCGVGLIAARLMRNTLGT